jgi:apolipoprotein N-acyltransferase
MRALSPRAWTYLLISAALQILIFPVAGPLSPWCAALSWVALAPLFAALLLPSRTGHRLPLRDAALAGYLCGFVWYLGNCYWIYQTMNLYGGLPKAVALLILLLFALYLGLYHALFALLFALARRLGSGLALIAAPFLWIAVELARARITGFPWDLLGYSQVDNLLLTRLAPIGGVMAISFVLVAINSAMSLLLLPAARKRLILALAAAGVAICLQVGGHFALFHAASTVPTHTAVLLQENLLVGEAARGTVLLSREQEIATFSQWSSNPLVASADQTWQHSAGSSHPDVIVWPEAPAHLQSDDPAFREGMGILARTQHAAVIAGSLGVDRAPKLPRGYLLYDSASLFSSDGSYQSRYDKIHLVPWGEYVPFKAVFSFADRLTQGVGDMDRGSLYSVFQTQGTTYGVFICYESIFGDEVRQFVENGAQVLVNISDDGWYGDTGAPWQHLNMARMRAIENHRWLLRSTNTGVTTAIDPYGQMAFQAPRHVRAAFSFPFALLSDETFYTRHGDWFAWLCVVLSVLTLAASQLRPRSID